MIFQEVCGCGSAGVYWSFNDVTILGKTVIAVIKNVAQALFCYKTRFELLFIARFLSQFLIPGLGKKMYLYLVT